MDSLAQWFIRSLAHGFTHVISFACGGCQKPNDMFEQSRLDHTILMRDGSLEIDAALTGQSAVSDVGL